MKTDKEEINIGILDIYGFEIFEVIFVVSSFISGHVANYICFPAEKWLRAVLY